MKERTRKNNKQTKERMKERKKEITKNNKQTNIQKKERKRKKEDE